MGSDCEGVIKRLEWSHIPSAMVPSWINVGKSQKYSDQKGLGCEIMTWGHKLSY
jgi:hypothetical protein